MRGTARVLSLTDRGERRGAVLTLERTITDAASGTCICRLEQTVLLRGNGGFGGPPPEPVPAAVPFGAPEVVAHVGISRRAALIYRLSGDWNPLHLDPAVAVQAGFDGPILHGLASYGIAGVAVSRALGRDPAALAHLACRFSGVVMPGDTLTINIRRNAADAARFEAFFGERKVLDAGTIAWRRA
jgi:acyl dehydratase